MLMVYARAGESSIHRLGLIAKQFISVGTVIWEFTPGFDLEIPEGKLDLLSAPAREQVVYYSYFKRTSKSYLLSSDDDRFTNHSNQPNAKFIEDCTIALRDIAADEEITIDYCELGVKHWEAK